MYEVLADPQNEGALEVRDEFGCIRQKAKVEMNVD